MKRIFFFCLLLIVNVGGLLFADEHKGERPNIFFAIADGIMLVQFTKVIMEMTMK